LLCLYLSADSGTPALVIEPFFYGRNTRYFRAVSTHNREAFVSHGIAIAPQGIAALAPLLRHELGVGRVNTTTTSSSQDSVGAFSPK
jgi:hypothetical protein